MNRLGVLDPKSLPRFEVLEALDAETILDGRMGRFVELWKEHDPPAGAVYDVEGLEFDPSSCCATGSTRRRGLSRWPSRSAAISTRSPPAIPAASRASRTRTMSDIGGASGFRRRR
jgi:hypothetical protein